MKQRLGIAIAIFGNPEILILDEPINGLDSEGIKEIRDTILKLNKERNVTFLISSHNLMNYLKLLLDMESLIMVYQLMKQKQVFLKKNQDIV